MSKHTPGPWGLITNLSASENHRGFKIIGADGWRFADVFPVDEDGIEGKANARLIAAAPIMYEYVAIKADCGDNEALSILEKINGSA